MSVVEQQVAKLRARHPDLLVRLLASGARHVAVPSVALPAGWSKASTSVRFLVPPAYPFVAPDCFWTDPDLCLAGGRMPQNTGRNLMPEVGCDGLWFSWHVQAGWNPNRDTLSSWLASINDRLGRLT